MAECSDHPRVFNKRILWVAFFVTAFTTYLTQLKNSAALTYRSRDDITLGGSLDYVKDGFIAAWCNMRLERAGVVFKHQRWTSDPNNRSCLVACHYSGSQVLELVCATLLGSLLMNIDYFFAYYNILPLYFNFYVATHHK